MKTSEQINELAEALSLAQAKIQNAHKTATNPHYRSKYAPLEEVLAASKPMAEHGLSFTHMPCVSEKQGHAAITYALMHKSGQYMQGYAEIPLPSRGDNGPHAWAAGITYLRRITLASIVGIASDDDDDGNAAQGVTETPAKSAANTTATPKPSTADKPKQQTSSSAPSPVVMPVDVKWKDGQSAKGPWKMAIVTFDDDTTATTFDDAAHYLLNKAMDARQYVHPTVTTKTDPKWGDKHTITDLYICDMDGKPITQTIDVIISNVPFGNYQVADKTFKGRPKSLTSSRWSRIQES